MPQDASQDDKEQEKETSTSAHVGKDDKVDSPAHLVMRKVTMRLLII